MRCGDDPGDRHTPLREEVITERAAALCEAAEQAHSELPSGTSAPVYVIGTEVPVPGGEQEAETGLSVTRISDVERTISLARETFLARGLASAWDRVMAVVVQPGVEFGDATVFDYRREKAGKLSSYLEKGWKMVFEAHSTDYQTREALKKMVEDHFAILKVGPWLTFAFREAVFALDRMEKEWLSSRKSETMSDVRAILEKAMMDHPEHWIKYYHGDDAYLHFAREFSYSDRSRYYWPQPEVQAALAHLLDNLTRNPVPSSLLSQYLPRQYQAVRNGQISLSPVELIHHKILEVIDIYASACGMR
jgi:D-tagatose-1,6-bisphosphate aldolase subunit GatZ/KbaZ